MKKISALLVLFSLTLIIASCSKDKDSARLEGKWEFSKEGTMFGSLEILLPYEHAEGCNKDYIEMLAGGVYRDFSYENMGEDCELFTEEGTWTRSGNTITVVTDGDTFVAEILSLTKTTLKVKTIFEEEGEDVIYVTEFVRR